MNLVEVNQATIAELRRCGWRQGNYGVGDERKCVVGAALSATADEPTDAAFERWFDLACRAADVINLACWNDTSGRTEADVFALLEKVEELARNAEV